VLFRSDAELFQLGRRYGELDGEIAWLYADTFSKLARTLTAEQKAALVKLRGLESDESGKVFLYAERIAAPESLSTDAFFARKAKSASGSGRQSAER
jgi:hypothetical protein